MVGTISTEFLVEHLGAEKIGKIDIEENPPMVAVHKGKVIDPIGIFYSKKYNVVIIHAVTPVTGMEWKLAKTIANLAKKLNAKEIISLEGVGGQSNGDINKNNDAYYFTNFSKKLEKSNMKPLDEGIIMGVTGALLLKKDLKLSCIFAETHSALPDSRAAATVIENLENYLSLKIDVKPLIEKAERFEIKLKNIFEKTNVANKEKQKKELSYLG